MITRREFLETSAYAAAGVALVSTIGRAPAAQAAPLPAAAPPEGPFEIVGSPYLRTSDARPLSECASEAHMWREMVHFRMPDDWRTRLIHGF